MKTLEPRHLDHLLQEFYRLEMPDPWPALEAPAPVVLPLRQCSSSWLRRAGRLALAASVAFLLIGYLALASWFPGDARRTPLNGPHIGINPHFKKENIPKVPPPRLRPILHEDRVPNDPKKTVILQLDWNSSFDNRKVK